MAEILLFCEIRQHSNSDLGIQTPRERVVGGQIYFIKKNSKCPERKINCQKTIFFFKMSGNKEKEIDPTPLLAIPHLGGMSRGVCE